jgi:hypothetical protein
VCWAWKRRSNVRRSKEIISVRAGRISAVPRTVPGRQRETLQNIRQRLSIATRFILIVPGGGPDLDISSRNAFLGKLLQARISRSGTLPEVGIEQESHRSRSRPRSWSRSILMPLPRWRLPALSAKYPQVWVAIDKAGVSEDWGQVSHVT